MQIDNDFQKMFGERRDTLLSKWCDFVEANIQRLAEMINDPRAKESLLTLNANQGKTNLFVGNFHFVS